MHNTSSPNSTNYGILNKIPQAIQIVLHCKKDIADMAVRLVKN